VFLPLMYTSSSTPPSGVRRDLYGASKYTGRYGLFASQPLLPGLGRGFKQPLYIQLDRVEYSDTSCMNIDDLSSKSLWGVSNSAILPGNQDDEKSSAKACFQILCRRKTVSLLRFLLSKCLSKNRMHELEKDQSSGNLTMNR
jgi:hypothetical protein